VCVAENRVRRVRRVILWNPPPETQYITANTHTHTYSHTHKNTVTHTRVSAPPAHSALDLHTRYFILIY